MANEDTTLLLMIVSMLRKPGNICCRHKLFLKEIRNIFVSRTQILCPQQMLRARANGGNICVRNNVSATLCPRLPPPLDCSQPSISSHFFFNTRGKHRERTGRQRKGGGARGRRSSVLQTCVNSCLVNAKRAS